VLATDIAGLSGKDVRTAADHDGEVFLMVGGPPCQSFSSGGKRAALSDPRGNLIYEYLRLISEIRPQYFVLENVGNLATAALRHRPIKDRPGQHWNLKKYQHDDGLDEDEKSGSAIRQILADVEALDYGVSFGVLDSADFGAAQHRLRFVMIGSRDGLPLAMPTPTNGPDAGHQRFATLNDTIYDLRLSPGPHSQYTPEFARLFDLIAPGKNWRSLPPDLQKVALGGAFKSGGGKTGFFRRLSWDKPAPTITGKANRKASAICHPEFTRPLSVYECARIQGFPDAWKFHGAMNTQYLQIGNAVPIALGKAIGSAISKSMPRKNSFTAQVQLEVALRKLRAAARNKVLKRPSASLPLF
jgi:DNA (cytosine-5)-methyltransferase 1